MENKAFFVQYLTNQPVKVETHYIGQQDRRRPLTDVADLVAASTQDPTRRLLGLPEDYGPLTLHLSDGSAIPGNTLLAAIQQQVGSYEQPLIIKSGIVHGHTVGGIKNFVRESIATYWRVSGSISDSLAVKGVRSRMYQNADNYLGYYESGQRAFFYGESGTTLSINVLFEAEENALRFDSHLRNESITVKSPMTSPTIKSVVSETSTAPLGEGIYYKDYIPTDSESPQDTQSVITIQFSTFEETSDEFKYQRIWGKQKAVT